MLVLIENRHSSQARLLILSSLNTFWTKASTVLFIGQWWIKPSDWAKLKEMDHEIVGYHWDDRLKLYNDYKTSLEILDVMLPLVASSLNQYDNTNHSISYWRLNIGS